MKKLITYSLLALLVVACTGSRKMVKKALELETAGLYKDASDFYYDGLKRNYKNTKAIIGLKNTGQKVLDDKLEVFYKAYSFANYREAVYSYIDAQKYDTKLKGVSVVLDFPSHYAGYFTVSKEKYFDKIYREGRVLIAKKEYAKAENVFNEIIAIEPDYKEAAALSKVAYAEPLYQKGLEEMDIEHYRSAYFLFDKVVTANKNYKDAFELKKESRQSAMFTVTFLPYREKKQYAAIRSAINKTIANDLTRSKNPFLVVVDRENTERLIAEQKLALGGVVDERTASRAGQILGVKAVVIGEVVSINENKRIYPRSTRKVAFEKYELQKYDRQLKRHFTITQFRRQYYTEYTNNISVSITYNYQLISSETGEILRTGSFTRTTSDKIRYATYQGNYRELYPSENASYRQKRSFEQLFTARSYLKSFSELSPVIYKDISKTVTNQILAYENTRI